MKVSLLAAFLALNCVVPAVAEPTLIGFAVLPADTFEPADDPAAHVSGQFIEAKNGRSVPFATQPIQGISSVIAGDKAGTFLALSDNGYGAKANSADYVLTVYRVTPHFKTPDGGGGGGGTVDAAVAFCLRDPDHKVPWPIVADAATYPNSDKPIPPAIRDNRLLTGADLDVESFVRLPDGTFWIGDEFGPFLLHVSSDGKLLEPPVELSGEGMHSPDHPTKDPATAKIGRSAGFEAMAPTLFHKDEWPDPVGLFAFLEKPMIAAGRGVTFFGYAFNTFPDLRTWTSPFPLYDLPPDATAIGEAAALPIGGTRERPESPIFVLIERDDGQGGQAKHKQLALCRLNITSVGGQPLVWTTRKSVADLLDLADPHDLDGDGKTRFRFPFLTIESVLPVDERTVLVVNDNNYPFGNGRSATEPDATEFILIRFDRPLAELGGE